MYLHQIYASSYTPTNPLTGHLVFKNDSTTVQITLTEEEAAQFTLIGQAAYARHQAALIASIAAPLETNLIAAPVYTEYKDEVPL